MKAAQFGEYGTPEVLEIADIAEPHPGPGQVRIKVRAVGVNPVDWKIRSGMLAEILPATLPLITGTDAAGVVDEIGLGANGVAIGDEVFGVTSTEAIHGGAAAEYAVLDIFTAKPPTIGFAEAAGLPTAVETATRALDDMHLAEGQTLLIDGAAGGVGSAAVQLAARRGIRVIGTASEANHDHLHALGAIPTRYGAGLLDRVTALAPDGVHAALDIAGQGGLLDLIALTGDPQRVLSIADPEALNLGVHLSARVGPAAPAAWHALDQTADLVRQGLFVLPVGATFDLHDAARAHQHSQSGHIRGKIALTVA
ncbi:NADP-dependent oxidoreductase [Saccharopolyspora sp. K220]|uniref:NADP-dependent oxidoreductase n=1 Tax=Saccharopolyspora soli TaxID=2926618 RepID=UPI001F585F2D|nr:NADP-dependent oxidoreductase [Saccharopolyspora soli]MCI2421403.1 NADP-dependent oxidoreductase [Saccharopolyspora soli]